MRRWTLVLSTLAMTATLGLTSCDGGGDPVQQALRETAAANHSATVRETPPPASGQAAAGHNATPGDPAYIARMIEHHRSAVAMADVALARSRDPEIRRMAQAVKDTQTREIAEMRAWKPAAQPTP